MRAFISHSSEDNKFVRTLKDDLEVNGITTWVDEDELDYGDSLIEKLQNALEDSSHFIIVLSPNSVSSDWVKLELNKAKMLKRTEILKKIIPIKYRDCEIPLDIKDLLYAELSSEVVILDNNKVKFVGEGYQKFISRLIKTLKSPEKLLTEDDKKHFNNVENKRKEKEKEAKASPKISDLKSVSSVKFYLKVIPFTSDNLNEWRKIVKSDSNSLDNRPLNKIFPIILPTVLRLYKDTFITGDTISFSLNNIYKYTGHFAGYKLRSDTYTIAIPGTIRKYLAITASNIYLFEFNLNTGEINVIK